MEATTTIINEATFTKEGIWLEGRALRQERIGNIPHSHYNQEDAQ